MQAVYSKDTASGCSSSVQCSGDTEDTGDDRRAAVTETVGPELVLLLASWKHGLIVSPKILGREFPFFGIDNH